MSSFDINIDDGKRRTMKAEWSTGFQVDGFLVLSCNYKTLARSMELLDSRTPESDHTIKVPNNPDIYILHVYGLQTKTSERGQYKQVLCCAKMRIRGKYGKNKLHSDETNHCVSSPPDIGTLEAGGKTNVKSAGITDTKLHMKLTKYTKDFKPIKLEQEGTLQGSVEKKPPSEYKVVINESFTTPVQFFVMVAYDDSLSICCVDGKSLALSFPFDLPPATWVICQVFCKCQQTSVTRSNPDKFETFLTISENNQLYNLALKFNKPIGLREIKYFYRNKKRQYFDDIINDMDGVMIPKPKNNGGEQGSVINGNFRGLFFSTYIDIRTKRPQQFSFYGPTRFNVQAEVLFPKNCNLYFVDFYCHYQKHHMAVILTPESSCHNTFCKKYLHQLDIYNNPFLKLCEKDKSWVVMANMDMIVEVYYTETVNINSILEEELGYIEEIAVVGRGYVLPQGIPKRASCKTCNL